MVDHKRIGAEFVSILVDWLGAPVVAEIGRRSVDRPEGVCYSHEYCDANMAMLEAFERLGVASICDLADGTAEHAEALVLMHGAWEHGIRIMIAKAHTGWEFVEV